MPRRPFRVARSLTGLGLFATKPIRKRTRIVEYKGPILDHDEALRAEARGNRYLFEVSKHRTIDGTPRSNIARYANHSCNPNAEPIVWRGRVFIKTLRDIKPGEEIVYDYGIDYLKNVIGRSNCKCSRCRRRRAKRARELRASKRRRATRRKQPRAAT
jgi:SET domain-containing protein